MTRVDIGPYMRGLREHFSLSQQDVSERLHIRHRYIEAIEAGNYEAMPGRAYAKGYVHTYAEFLGLDADQVVEICFGIEPVREQQKHYVPEPQKRVNTRSNISAPWRSLAILGVIAAIAVLGLVQFSGGSGEEGNSTETVAEVPEEMLAQTRTLLMPSATNSDCLQETGPLGCILDSASWQQMQALSRADTVYFASAGFVGAGTADQQPAEEETEGSAEEE
jgi:cytoskeletal protein RodZ